MAAVIRRLSNPESKDASALQATAAPSPLVVEMKEVAKKSEVEELSEKAVFTNDPLPEKLLFKDSDYYLIPLPKVGYDDSKFACRKILSHTILAIGIINKIESEVRAIIQNIKEKLTEAYARKLTPYTQTKTTENADLWRERVIIFWKQTKYIKHINLKKLDKSYEYLKVLAKLKKICNELIKRPRMMTINQSQISKIPSAIKNEIAIKKSIRLKALDALLADVKTGMKFIPRLFTNPEVCAMVLMNVIQSAMHYKDPLTNYLPATLEGNAFSDLIQSRFSPIRYCEKQPDTIENLIELTVEMMKSFAAIKQKDHIYILTSLAVRYWFDRTLVCNEFYPTGDPKFVIYLQSLKHTVVSSHKPPKIFAKADKHRMELSVNDFFMQDKLLRPAIDSLFMLSFYTSPTDIAFEVHVIDLRLAGYVAAVIKKDINDKNTVECVAFLWRLLIIVSDLPFPDTLFEFVMRYAEVAYIPTGILKKANIPTNIVRQLLLDMKKSHFLE